jgi:diguanylate cyclase (GGDEF)-like protein
LVLEGRLEGVFVAEQTNTLPGELIWSIFRQAMLSQKTLSRMRSADVKDESTGFWKSAKLYDTLAAEVSRARRIGLPVSLLVVQLDVPKEADIKRLGKVMERTSRLNDILIRINFSQVAAVLPHTHLYGAATKAERLRRIVEALGGDMTVSVGVSEYPRCATDSEGLLRSADDALYTVTQLGRNKVCISSDLSVPEGNVSL